MFVYVWYVSMCVHVCVHLFACFFLWMCVCTEAQVPAEMRSIESL